MDPTAPDLPPPSAEPSPEVEVHRLAVERRQSRQGASAWPQGAIAAQDQSRDGTWRSPGYRPARTRSQVAIGFVVAAVLMDGLATLLGIQGIGLMSSAEAGTLAAGDAEAFDSLYAMVGLAQSLMYIASAIAVLRWLSRTVEIIPSLTGRTPRRSPREAIGWWFVPFANYVVPFQIVSDTLRRLRTGDPELADRLLVPWWVCWLVASWVGSLIFRLPRETIDELRQVFTVTALSDVANVVAGVCLIMIIRTAQRRSDARAATLAAEEQHAPDNLHGGPVVQGIAVEAHGVLQPPPPPGSPSGQ
jgi:hypothetical protein